MLFLNHQLTSYYFRFLKPCLIDELFFGMFINLGFLGLFSCSVKIINSASPQVIPTCFKLSKLDNLSASDLCL